MRGALGAGVLVMMLSATPTLAQQSTEIFKCRGEQGQITYTNDRRQAEKQKCQLVASQINVAPTKQPPGFPRESARDSAKAKERQREILEKELRAEEQALGKAREALAQQETTRTGGEQNYARVQERLQPFKDTISNHEKNIQALQRELGNLK